mmetsp:Transcript_47017/g.69659  ORF Transcript_47017/g.69659 Transcript_47017/m.69659 type:complete len:80 (-) Transcript_47017:181-420(-)
MYISTTGVIISAATIVKHPTCNQNAVAARVSRSLARGKSLFGTGTPRKSQSGFHPSPASTRYTNTGRPSLAAYSWTSRT